ncbi:MAG: hypothetical protein KKB21_04325, partial [Nanoarchaeota archaeon]|nr:hypothetical protein [Nanoarchaeota archaeon]
KISDRNFLGMPVVNFTVLIPEHPNRENTSCIRILKNSDCHVRNNVPEHYQNLSDFEVKKLLF